MEQLFHRLGYVAYFGAGKQFQVQQHLVVARASAVYFLSYIAQASGQHQFHLRVHVFHPVFNGKLAAFGQGVEVFQLGQQLGQFVGSEQPDAFQHGDVCHRAQDVILRQVEVHFAVAPYRKAFYVFVYLDGFLPKFLSHGFGI